MTSPHPLNQTNNTSLNNSPFIWGNIALLAGVPWLLTLSMAGLAVGDPVFSAWFEIFLLGFPAISLVAWVQWQQPFSPFSLWFVTKPTESLSDRDRQILTLIKQHSNGWYVTGWIATAVAIFMSVIFCKIYISAPLAQAIAPFSAGLRLFGILWAEIFFLLSNVLLQAGISALRIKLTAESELNGLKPFASEKIKNSFTSIGWQSPQILKFFEENGTEPIKLDIASIASELDLEPEANIEVNNFVTEVAELEISAIVAEESVIETTAELETEQFLEEPQIETISNQEIIQEPEELNPFELVEDEEFDIDVVLGSTEDTANLNEEIAEEAGELEAFETIEDLEAKAITTQDFDDELDELIAFNAYVENILSKYLEDVESMEAFTENLLDLETQAPDDIAEEISNNEQVPQDPEYLVQELLVDKFLARIEELNIADKAKNTLKPNPEIDEFADLEALLDGKPENLEPKDLSDRNS